MRTLLLIAAFGLSVVGCDSATDTDPAAAGDAGTAAPFQPIEQPLTYTFDSRFGPGSSVSHGGQTKRLLLAEALATYLVDATEETFDDPQDGEVVAALNFYFDFQALGFPDFPVALDAPLPLLQTKFGDLGELVDLRQKMADVDAGFTGGVIGFGGREPLAVIESIFRSIELLIQVRAAAGAALDPTGAPIEPLFVDPVGRDFQQILEHFLAGAVFYSQAADDYLDDDLEGKGLNSDNTAPVEGEAYTALEHAWDEAFGYFGAPVNYAAYTAEMAVNDLDGDGKIDVLSEACFGYARAALSRDQAVPSGFADAIFDNFLAGRTVIVNANGALDDAAMAALRGHRDALLAAWEDTLGATTVHHLNAVLVEMARFGTDAYSYRDHARHWSALTSVALALQFNVNHSDWTPDDLATLQRRFGNAPALPGDTPAVIDAYRAGLLEARALVGRVHGFDAAQLGDDHGLNGW